MDHVLVRVKIKIENHLDQKNNEMSIKYLMEKPKEEKAMVEFHRKINSKLQLQFVGIQRKIG